MEAKPDFEAKRNAWRGTVYDSQLERDWAATFTAWGIEFVYHPGQMYLGVDIWEPDFQLEGDIIFEVKGEHNHRIEKAWEAKRMGFKVVVGRPGLVVGGNDVEFACAVWEPKTWVVDAESMTFKHWNEAKERYWSADTLEELSFIRWFKAVGSAGVQ